jgi:hypothetical protein
MCVASECVTSVALPIFLPIPQCTHHVKQAGEEVRGEEDQCEDLCHLDRECELGIVDLNVTD